MPDIVASEPHFATEHPLYVPLGREPIGKHFRPLVDGVNQNPATIARQVDARFRDDNRKSGEVSNVRHENFPSPSHYHHLSK